MNRTELIKRINSELNKLPKIRGNDYYLYMHSTDTKEGRILNSLKIKLIKKGYQKVKGKEYFILEEEVLF